MNTWTREGRGFSLNGTPAIYLDRSVNPTNKGCPLAPWKADSLARQLQAALDRGLIALPDDVGTIEAFEAAQAARMSAAAALPGLIEALEDLAASDSRLDVLLAPFRT